MNPLAKRSGPGAEGVRAFAATDALLTAAEMRAAEHAAMASGRVTGLDLMERAGRGVVTALLSKREGFAHAPHDALILCGPGNNGGDGYVVARHLRQRGWRVEVMALGDPARLPPDAAANHTAWREMGGGVHAMSDGGGAFGGGAFGPFAERAPDLLVDALFGTGLARPLDPGLAGVLRDLSGAGNSEGRQPIRVAVDLPSGLCSDSGRVLGGAENDPNLRCDMTVTFHLPRPGHVLEEGPDRCGDLRVVDIGCSVPEAGQWVEGRPHALAVILKSAGHKYDHGHALILSGGPGRGGAARLAARAALRVGAGLVTLGCPPAALQENAARLDAVMLARIGDGGALAAALDDARLSALCLGPGLGTDRAAEMVRAARETQGPRPPATVLDADALTAFADDPAALFDLVDETCVLTPHWGEFGRLFPDLAEACRAQPATGPALSRLDVARQAAQRCGAVVLLKGPGTVIAHPDGTAAINPAVYRYAVPWLATAGAGDVLAGMIAGLLARGFPAWDAARHGAALHTDCARAFGPGLIAEDLPEMVPGVLSALA